MEVDLCDPEWNSTPEIVKYGEWILRAIDKLRERRARPDLNKIAAHMKRYYNVSMEETSRLLKVLEENKTIISIGHKGIVSYRNPQKLDPVCRNKEGAANSRRVSKAIREAVSRLLSTRGTKQNCVISNDASIATLDGLSIDEIEEAATDILQSKTVSTNENIIGNLCDSKDISVSPSIESNGILRATLVSALERECAFGSLSRLQDGRFVPGVNFMRRRSGVINKVPIKPIQRRLEPRIVSEIELAPSGEAQILCDQQDVNSSDHQSRVKGRKGRPPGSKNKVKRQGLVALQHHQTKKRKLALTTPFSSEINGYGTEAGSKVCYKCNGGPLEFESLLSCSDCGLTTHPSCLGYWAELAESIRRGPWQCSFCKTCCICSGLGAPEEMFICDACDKGFHASCHEPPLSAETASDSLAWVCSKCHKEGHKVVPPTPPQEQVPLVDSLPTEVPTPVPDSQPLPEAKEVHIRNWAVNDVYQWLLSEGFPREARAFREQEIDGASLLLMKRMDILTELGIKLGPAVKIYEKVKDLQLSETWQSNGLS